MMKDSIGSGASRVHSNLYIIIKSDRNDGLVSIRHLKTPWQNGFMRDKQRDIQWHMILPRNFFTIGIDERQDGTGGRNHDNNRTSKAVLETDRTVGRNDWSVWSKMGLPGPRRQGADKARYEEIQFL